MNRAGPTPIDLRRLVEYAYHVHAADRVCRRALHALEARADGVPWRETSRDGVASLMRRHALGCTVDGGTAWVGGALPPDAEAVHEAVEGLSGSPVRTDLIVRYARRLSVPDWSPPPSALVALPGEGQGARAYRVESMWEQDTADYARLGARYGLRHADGRKFARGQAGLAWRAGGCYARRWSPVRPDPDPATIAAINAEYRTWHDAMCRLEVRLRRVRLRDHRLTGFSEPAEPWHGCGSGSKNEGGNEGGSAVAPMAGQAVVTLRGAAGMAFVRSIRHPMLVLAHAGWAGACKPALHALGHIAADMIGRVTVASVDIDAAPDIALHLGIDAVPTLLLFVGGEMRARDVARDVGCRPMAAVYEWVETRLGMLASAG